VTLVGAIVFYVVYLFPKIAEVLGPLGAQMPPLTAATLEVSQVVQANLFLIAVAIILITAGAYLYVLSPQGRMYLDQYIVRIPYVGRILKNTSVEIFCRVLGIMYNAGENIDALQLAAESNGNRYLARQVKTVAIPAMLKYGTELARAMEYINFFPELFISRFRTAAETGTIKDTATQLADYYQMENQYAMKNLVGVIELSVTVLIMSTMVFLTLLSSETATINVDPRH
ncbi:MAG: type II secretion system F family protein, partial [Bacteroidota bacterium]